MKSLTLSTSVRYGVAGACLLLFGIALPEYRGSAWIYTLFSLLSGALLYSAFRERALFFDTFIGVFFWLGFWLKLTIRVAFTDGVFGEAVGHFDGSGAAFDRALLVASCGLGGLLAAGMLREKLLFRYPDEMRGTGTGTGALFFFYHRYRKPLLLAFLSLIVTIGVSNAYLAIYQKGTVTQTVLPWGLNGVYKWLLLFGLASVSALVIKFELGHPRRSYLRPMLLGLFECFVSSVSLLSRGMILNGAALLYGSLVAAGRARVVVQRRSIVAAVIAFVLLFAASVLAVNYIRAYRYQGLELSTGDTGQAIRQTQETTNKLFIDRWVGMEGVMAVTSHPDLGWDLWKTAWQERYNENETSFYDLHFIESPYLNVDKTRHHFISLPGIIAFFFYPGSFAFLFFGMFVLGLFAAFIEIAAFKWCGGNLILCSLIAQVIAYRYASFGYVPQQSYLLFGTIAANLLLIYLLDKSLGLFVKRSWPETDAGLEQRPG